MSPEEVKLLRQLYGLSLRAFAEKVGVAHTTIVRWENGSNRPKGLQLASLERLAKQAAKTRR